MKLRHGVWCVLVAIIALLAGSCTLRAQDQDVAAAARANRAAHPNAASVPSISDQGPNDAEVAAGTLRMCLADNTSGRDRKDLAKWVFFAMAAHPEMKQYADANATAADESSKTMAALVTRLLTQSCAKEVKAAMKTGAGPEAVKLAFKTLGELAMQELMTDKSVQDAMGAFGRYVDQPRLNAVLADK